jgi:hypothetical protein
MLCDSCDWEVLDTGIYATPQSTHRARLKGQILSHPQLGSLFLPNFRLIPCRKHSDHCYLKLLAQFLAVGTSLLGHIKPCSSCDYLIKTMWHSVLRLLEPELSLFSSPQNI